MDRQALRERLMTTFAGELEEHVQAFTRDLLAIEQTPAQRPERLASLFRAAHSLKGAARSVDIPQIEAVCHQLESLLGAAREQRYTLDAAAMQLLFAAARGLDDAATRVRTRAELTPGPLQDLLPRLTHAAQELERPARSSRARAIPPAVPVTAATTMPPVSPRDTTVRVPADTLDSLLAGSGELLVARRRAAAEQGDVAALREQIRTSRAEWQQLARPLRTLLRSDARLLPQRAVTALDRTDMELKTLERRVDQLSARLAADQFAVDRAAITLDEQIRRVRLFPFSQACEGLVLAIRELASATPVDLVIEGGDIRLDRFVLEGIRAPLQQLVRNAVSHGIETPGERRAAGKPERGVVTVTATLQGDAVEIVVGDDGRGLDLDALRALARSQGLPAPGSDSEAARLIFRPGFSTASHLTEVSGRGIGLDIVRHQTELLRGHVETILESGRGLQVRMHVPVTVTTLRALLVKVAGQTFAVPVTGIRRLVRASASDFAAADGRDVLLTSDGPIPVASLDGVLGIDAPTRPVGARVPLVIMGTGRVQVAVAVHELLGEEELLLKTLGPRLKRVRHVAGATLLPSGHVALVLNAAEVVQSALATPAGARQTAPVTAPHAAVRRRLLLADDSVTTRTLERTILEAAGYEVLVAVDGVDAWELLGTTDVDLVVADVEMPRLDGLALCEAIRGSARLRGLPVVLVTALESASDRQRGLDAGANAYLAKSSFDQQLLVETIGRLL